MPLSDIEIAQQAKMQRATELAAKLGIPEDAIERPVRARRRPLSACVMRSTASAKKR